MGPFVTCAVKTGLVKSIIKPWFETAVADFPAVSIISTENCFAVPPVSPIAEAGITEPKNLEEQAISLAGRDVYEKLIKGYTEKQ